MTDIHTQIRDNVERLEKRRDKVIKEELLMKPFQIKDKSIEVELLIKDEHLLALEVTKAELKTTIAENIKCADAMIEELEDSLCRRRGEFKLMEGIKVETNRGRYAFLLNEKDREIFELNTKIKKWQETKQRLEERQ